MSILFKKNSRFASLIEDNDDNSNNNNKPKDNNNKSKDNNLFSEKEVKFNTFKNDNEDNNGFTLVKNRNKDQSYSFRQYDERYRRRDKKEIEAEENEKKARDKLEKERLKKESLKQENFPSLVTDVKYNDNKELQIRYIEKIKQTKNKIVDNIDPDLVNLKSGWVLFKKESKSGNTIIKTLPGEAHLLNPTNQPQRTDQQIGRDILKSLADLHEKRTKEYIETYGEYTWEKMFKRPNWREEELENLSESEYSEDECEDNTDDDNYDGY